MTAMKDTSNEGANHNSTHTTNRALDGGWGYVVLCGVVLAVSLLGGIHMVSTLIYQALLEKFNKSASATAWVLGVQGCLAFSFSPISSMCCNQFGFRITVAIGTCLSAGGLISSAFPASLETVYFTFGIMSGIGHSLIATVCFSIVPIYFDKKQGRANAIASTGVPIGALVLAPLLTFLFDKYGYTGTMLILGGLMLHVFVTALLFRPHRMTVLVNIGKRDDKYDSENQESHKQHDEPDTVNMEMQEFQIQTRTESRKIANEKPPVFNSKLKVYIHILGDSTFIAFAVSVMCLIFMLSCNAFLAGLAKERHITDIQITVILVVTSVATCLSRILFGILFDINCIKERRMILYCFFSAASGVLCCLFPFAGGFASLLVLNLVTNILSQGMHGQHLTVLSDLIGRKRVVSAVGICRLIMGLGYLTGPVVGGVLRDHMGTYDSAYYLAGAMPVFGMTVFFLFLRFKCTNNKS